MCSLSLSLSLSLSVFLSLSFFLCIKDALSASCVIYLSWKQSRVSSLRDMTDRINRSIGENGQKWKNAREMVHSRITALDLSHSIIHNMQMLINFAH